MRTIAPSMPSHACPGSAAEGPAEVLCRRRQRYKYMSVMERLCTEKAGYVNSTPLYSWANEEPAWFCPRPHRIIFICRLIQVNEGAIITKLLVLPASLCGLACSF